MRSKHVAQAHFKPLWLGCAHILLTLSGRWLAAVRCIELWKRIRACKPQLAPPVRSKQFRRRCACLMLALSCRR
jgi:hypothetical protein